MIYYHFADKLALYRAVVGDMLGSLGATATETALLGFAAEMDWMLHPGTEF